MTQLISYLRTRVTWRVMAGPRFTRFHPWSSALISHQLEFWARQHASGRGEEIVLPPADNRIAAVVRRKEKERIGR
jgi:hypothetical protein